MLKYQIYLCAALILGGISGCTFLKSYDYPDDNLVEEIVEEVIEDRTGIDVDLSPLSPESAVNN